MIQIIDAIRALVPNAECTFSDTKIGRWHDSRPQPTQAEIDTKFAELQAAEPMRLLRIERNQKLAETDWIITKGLEQGADITEWKTYRQALRDLPTTTEPQLHVNGNLTNITWPEVPE
tara:strand:- start:457 stop:810 length:354 start_codon:yes stop_codon:yes gene_type:complete